MTEDFQTCWDVLLKHGVPFCIIGGHAVGVHGFLRTTEDVDILFHRTPESEPRLVEALLAMNARWIADEIDPATGFERQVPVDAAYVSRQRMMILMTDLGFLDIFDYVPGLPSTPVAELINSALVVQGVPYVSRDWLLKLKRAAGRPQDLRDITMLGDD